MQLKALCTQTLRFSYIIIFALQYHNALLLQTIAVLMWLQSYVRKGSIYIEMSVIASKDRMRTVSYPVIVLQQTLNRAETSIMLILQ